MNLILTGLAMAAPISLNQSTADELSTLEGVSPEQAEQITAFRDQHGRLNSVESLRSLDFSDATLNVLRQGTFVEIAFTGSPKSFESPDQVLQSFAHEPDIQEVHQLVMEYTMTHRDQVEQWLSASQNAAWLPELKLRYSYDTDVDADYVYLDPEDATVFQYDEGSQDWGSDYRVELRWRLDELMMSSEQIRVISEAQDVVKLREKVLKEVTRLYFDRRRLQVDRLLSPPSGLQAQLESELRLMELTASLDAYSGGRFSMMMER